MTGRTLRRVQITDELSYGTVDSESTTMLFTLTEQSRDEDVEAIFFLKNKRVLFDEHTVEDYWYNFQKRVHCLALLDPWPPDNRRGLEKVGVDEKVPTCKSEFANQLPLHLLTPSLMS